MQGADKNCPSSDTYPHGMQIKRSNVARVFFALWPEASVRQALHTLAMEYQSPCEARVMSADTLHMTLLFMGEIARACLPQLMQTADKVSVPAFGFILERVSFWQHNRIAYAAPLEKTPALDQLVAMLEQAVIAADFQFDHHEFKPHVTLLRNAGHASESQFITPIKWWVDSFVLVESVTTELGVSYQILQTWPLSPITAQY